MAKDQSSLVSTDDVTGIYSVSDFLNYMPDQLCFSESSAHLRVFFLSGHNLTGLRREGTETIKEKIKSALQLLDISYIPTLVQFWAPKHVSSQQFLETFDFPFGVSVLRKGLCWYRKKCLNYKYSVDDESTGEESSPVGRVFRNRYPEFNPDVSLYSGKEYKLRDFAVFCGVQGYLALPVFESGGQHFHGVLELLSIFDGSYSLTDKIGKVDEALKAVGLRSSKICSPFDMESSQSSEREFALAEIKKVLEATCCMHKLPFAQAWFCTKEKNCCGDFLCTSEEGSYMLAKSVSRFQKECIRLRLKKGKNAVWKAFTSGTSCFCRDIKQLSTTEYFLVNVARKCRLTGCFAICLRSTDGSDSYVLEFFLASIQLKEPQAFLNSLLATVKNHSQSFMVASGQKLGAELSVEAINPFLDKEGDSSNIFQSHRPPQGSQNQVQNVRIFSDSIGKNCFSKGKMSEIKVVSGHCGKELGNPAGNSLHSSAKSAASPSKLNDLRKRKDEVGTRAPPNKRKADQSLSWKEDVRGAKSHNLELHQTNQTSPACSPENPIAQPVPQATGIQIESPIIIKASYEENIIKFQFSLKSGIRDFEHEVEKRLELKAGDYDIKHLTEDNSLISLVSDAELQNFMRTMISKKKTTIKLLLEPVKIPETESCSNPVACPLPQTTEIENKTPMFVKVMHNDETIKFQLSLSAGIEELRGEVMKRLKLDCNGFGIKYLGEENKWIPIASDTHLQGYMSDMRSRDLTTVRFSLDLFTN